MSENLYPFTAWFDPYGFGDPPPSLTIKPTWYKITDHGGPERAEIEITGPESALWVVLTWLGRKVSIVNPYGDIVWTGKTTAVDLTVSGYTVGLSYDSMYNRVRVLYTYDGPDGAPLADVTEWGNDTISQSTHGVREFLHSMSDAYQADAESKRDRIIAEFAKPKGVPSIGSAKPGATITATGLFALTDWVYYENLTGRLEHSVTTDQALPLGWQISGTGINFAAGRVHDIDGRLTELTTDDYITIANSQSNDGTYKINDGTKASAVDITRTSLYVEPTDDIREQDLAESFIADGFVGGEVVQLIDWVTVDGYYLTEGNTEQYRLDVEVSWNGGFSYEENLQEDDPVRIKQGNSVGASGLTLEVTDGTSTTITAHGFQFAQKVQAPGSWSAGLISLSLQKVGSPVDSVRVFLYTDNSDDIGTLIGSGFISAADVPTEMQKVWVRLGATVPITSGSYYWIVVDRNGSPSHENFYRVGVTTSTYSAGRMQVYDGTTWHDRSDISLSFLMYAVQDTGEQIEDILSGNAGQFFSKVVIQDGATGVEINQWQDGRSRAGTLLRDLMRRGVGGGQRLIANVDQDDVLLIYQEPLPDEADAVQVRSDGTVLQPSGGPMPYGTLPVGQWVVLADLPTGDESAYVGELSPMYISEGEIDIASGSPPKLTPRVLGVTERLINA